MSCEIQHKVKAATPVASTNGTQEGQAVADHPKPSRVKRQRGPLKRWTFILHYIRYKLLTKGIATGTRKLRRRICWAQPAPRGGEVGEVGQCLPI